MNWPPPLPYFASSAPLISSTSIGAPFYSHARNFFSGFVLLQWRRRFWRKRRRNKSSSSFVCNKREREREQQKRDPTITKILFNFCLFLLSPSDCACVFLNCCPLVSFFIWFCFTLFCFVLFFLLALFFICFDLSFDDGDFNELQVVTII